MMQPRRPILLSREEFREQVFSRDETRCVVCGAVAVDAHHILDRKLFDDGGYYLNNGVSLCDVHHKDAEGGRLSVEYLRQVTNIIDPVLPTGLTSQVSYDKWGNVSELVKYPRTYHFPWSPNLQNDDRMLESTDGFVGREVIMTEKMDGENTTMYRDHIHARSLDSQVHPSRYWVRGLWGGIKHEIPEDMRICGENLYAKHSIKYADLPTYFMCFNMWRGNLCLSWDDTLEWCELLGLCTVPPIYRGPWDEKMVRYLGDNRDYDGIEGYVVRVTDSFSMAEYSTLVGKCVRAKHVRSSEHWMHEAIEPNGLRHGGRPSTSITETQDRTDTT